LTLTVRELTPELWPKFEKLFGDHGACGGCWCMAWRCPDGEKWADLKGPRAHDRMKELVLSGKAHGMLAFDGEEAVGWCSFAPRLDFPKLQRARSLACDDAERVWSLPCFFIRRDWRGKGVATQLLKAAVKALRARGAEIAEGYPVRPAKPGEKIPHAFAWVGTRALFEKAGFQVVGNAGGSKERMRLELGRRR
jgi:GNAT superfamily N-acetyltransferase